MKQFETLIQLLDNFPDEETCRKHFEQMRWPDGEPACPRCGDMKVYRHKDGKLFTCHGCKKQFTVLIGTVFSDTHIPLRKWFMALYLLTAHKKGISSLQLSKDIGVTQKTAWFMLHRIRYILHQGSLEPLQNIVEADEIFIGGKPKKGDRKLDENGKRIRKSGAGTTKPIVFGMVERGGRVIAQTIPARTQQVVQALIRLNIMPGCVLITDEHNAYNGLDEEYDRKTINHSLGEYSDKQGTHTNTIEGFWGLMKRGFIGIYHSMSRKHLDLYCDEFTFRYSTRLFDSEKRFNKALSQSDGRLMYKELISKQV
jgi:transposase-like protein